METMELGKRLGALLLSLLMLAGVAGTALAQTPSVPDTPQPPIRVLLFSGTYGFRHDSINIAKEVFGEIGEGQEFDFTITEDPADVTEKTLKQQDVLFFVSATGETPFSPEQQDAIIDFVREDGHGFAGIHASADGNYTWPEYGDLLGAYFIAHPHGGGVAMNEIEDATNPIMGSFGGENYARDDEYYKVQLDPRPNVHVLASLINDSISEGPVYVDSQPTTWCQNFGAGRSFYTNWGHGNSTYQDPKFIDMVLQGLRWAAGRLEADCSAPSGEDRIEAEWADDFGGAQRATSTEVGADQVLSYVRPSGFAQFDDVDLSGVTSIDFRASGESAPDPGPYRYPAPKPALGGTIEIHLDEPTGPLLGSVAVPGRPGWATLNAPITATDGVHDLVLRFRNTATENWVIAAFLPEFNETANFLFSLSWLQLKS